MRAQSTSSATFLMLLVLGLTAVVGVFGVPQFSPVVASSGSESDVQLTESFGSFQDARVAEVQPRGTEDLFAPVNQFHAHEASAGDLFAPVDLDRLEDEASADRRIVDLVGGPAPRREETIDDLAFDDRTTAAAGDRQLAAADTRSLPTEFAPQAPERTAAAPAPPHPFDDEPRRIPAANPVSPGAALLSTSDDRRPTAHAAAERTPATAAPAAAPANEPLTWRAAVGQLNALGIRQYRLSPGSQPNEFHFSCFLSPDDNPRVTHRFEAEAGEPLAAVEKVLQQVAAWRNGQ